MVTFQPTSFSTGITLAVIAFAVTITGIVLLKKVFPGFISRERKEGQYRNEDIRKIDPVSTKLPHLAGIAALIALSFTLILGSHLGWVDASFRWFLVPIWAFSVVGFLDDLRKTTGKGISQRVKFVLTLVLSILLSYVLFTRFGFDVPYKPYNLVSYFLVPAIWAIWFFFMATTVSVGTTLAMGFSDGMDGLLAGLWLIAALAYAIPTTINDAVIASTICFVLAGTAGGVLVFNLPSNWASGKTREMRRARVYLGETGAMMVGSSFAFLAILSQTELAWIIIGGVFVLEGGTALYQAKILTPLFRRYMSLPKHLRTITSGNFPHTEFPLPFLATPFHCHLDLLGLGRLRIVISLWFLGIVLGLLGMSTMLIYDLFGKATLWTMGAALLVLVWLFGTWTKPVFMGFHDTPDGQVSLTLNRGRPYKLFGHRAYWTEEHVRLQENDLPKSEILSDIVFWRLMDKSDALMMIGHYFFEAGDHPRAVEYWDRVPDRTLQAHPAIHQLFINAKETHNFITSGYPYDCSTAQEGEPCL